VQPPLTPGCAANSRGDKKALFMQGFFMGYLNTWGEHQTTS
jgi:hypothetical protein